MILMMLDGIVNTCARVVDYKAALLLSMSQALVRSI